MPQIRSFLKYSSLTPQVYQDSDGYEPPPPFKKKGNATFRRCTVWGLNPCRLRMSVLPTKLTVLTLFKNKKALV